MARTFIKIAGFLLLGFSIIYTIWWFFLAKNIETQISQFQIGETDGPLTIKNYAVSGYPIDLMATVTNPSFTTSTLEIETQKATASALPFQPQNIQWRIEEPTKLQFSAQGRDSTRASFKSASGSVHYDVTYGGVDAVEAYLDDLSVKLPIVNRVLQPISLFAPKAHLSYKHTPNNDKTAEIYGLELSHAELTGMSAYGLTGGVDRFSLYLSPKGTIATPLSSRNLAIWRNDGGNLQIEDLTLSWGTIKFQSTGTLRLDQNLQPVGQIKGDLYGYDDLLKSLYKAEILNKQQLNLTRNAFKFLAKTDAQTQQKYIPLQIILQDRQLKLGSITIATLPEIIWD